MSLRERGQRTSGSDESQNGVRERQGPMSLRERGQARADQAGARWAGGCGDVEGVWVIWKGFDDVERVR